MFAKVERDQGLLRVILVGLFIVALPIALITTTIRVAISEQAIYDYSVRHYDAERVSGISESELIRANGEIRDYLVKSDPGPLAPKVTNSDGQDERLFNAKETIHMADVRDLVQLMFTAQLLAVAASLALAALIVSFWSARVLAVGLLYGASLVGVVLGVGGALAMTGFDAAWSEFHVIAFTNDLWQLDPDTDHLIQMFPERFWQQVTLWIGGAIILQALVIAVLSAAYLLLTRERVERPVHEAREAVAAENRPELPGRAGHAPRLAPPNPRHYIR
jgi:integral membrane protein (TIGR01906 family)